MSLFPPALQAALNTLEDPLLERGSVLLHESANATLEQLTALTTWFEAQHAEWLPAVLEHGFVAAAPMALAPLFHDDALRAALGLAQQDPVDDALRLQFMAACIGEVLSVTAQEALAPGHLRCGLIALRCATEDAVLALTRDAQTLRWVGLFRDPQAFEGYLQGQGYCLSEAEWDARPALERLAGWGLR